MIFISFIGLLFRAAIATAVAYSVVAFVTMEPSVFVWGSQDRGMMVLMAFLICLFTLPVRIER